MKLSFGFYLGDETAALAGHATLHPIAGKDTEFDLSRLLMEASVVVLDGAAIVKLALHVKAWWESRLTAHVERSGVAGYAVAGAQPVPAQAA